MVGQRQQQLAAIFPDCHFTDVAFLAVMELIYYFTG
jgi:hypothetical protein